MTALSPAGGPPGTDPTGTNPTRTDPTRSDPGEETSTVTSTGSTGGCGWLPRLVLQRHFPDVPGSSATLARGHAAQEAGHADVTRNQRSRREEVPLQY